MSRRGATKGSTAGSDKGVAAEGASSPARGRGRLEREKTPTSVVSYVPQLVVHLPLLFLSAGGARRRKRGSRGSECSRGDVSSVHTRAKLFILHFFGGKLTTVLNIA